MSTDHLYLDNSAAKLAVQYSDCGDYISELLVKYKKTLADGSVNIGTTPGDVIISFENSVRKQCSRPKADRMG